MFPLCCISCQVGHDKDKTYAAEKKTQSSDAVFQQMAREIKISRNITWLESLLKIRGK